MDSELALWDQISLGLVLVFVIIYIYNRIKEMFESSSGGCGNCGSSNSCGRATNTIEPMSDADKEVGCEDHRPIIMKQFKSFDSKR